MVWHASSYRGFLNSPQRFICQTIGLVTNCVQCCIGNGSSTSFWKDSWLSCGVISIALPPLFPLVLHLDDTVADVWIDGSTSQDLHLCRNLNDLEISELATLSHHLSSVRIHSTSDTWTWPIDPSLTLTVKSLMANMVGSVDSPREDLYSIVWKDQYPKKVKIFLWELSLGAINTTDRLQRRMPYMYLSPSWCHMCCQHVESPPHLFAHCSFATCFWNFILEAFGWSLTCPNSISNLLASLLVGHPFGSSKRTIWLVIVHAFFWTLWGERNDRLFRGSYSPFEWFMDLVLANAFLWCSKHPFTRYSFFFCPLFQLESFLIIISRF